MPLSDTTPQICRQDHFVFEVTQRCNYDCPHCYNVWKNPVHYPVGELDTAGTLDILQHMLTQTGATLVTLSGGEPLLRPDLPAIVDFLAARRLSINLITNGSLVDDRALVALAPAKISLWELPLLSAEKSIHDRMSGSTGAYDRVTMAIATLKAAGERVVTVFVATKWNLPTWTRTVELALALGADGVMFNRFNPGGRGCQNIEALQASPRELAGALEEADRLSERYHLPISSSIPMPPCLFDAARYPHLSFGFCAAGTSRAYYTLDPLGNVRPCNHSPSILGNIRSELLATMVAGPAMHALKAARPEFCRGCVRELECQGGCKAAAEACCGSPSQCDPFLAAFRSQAVRPGFNPGGGPVSARPTAMQRQRERW